MESTADTSHLLSFLLAGKSVRGVILDGTILVQEMQDRHALASLETLILGQALQVIVLMASTLKSHDKIDLRIDCSGPVKGLVAEATATGEVRGYLKQVPVPLKGPLETFDEAAKLTPCWGDGCLTINRYLGEGRQPFSGTITLQSGNMASELARYYLLSEQIPTAIHLSLSFDIHGRINGAGGLLIQALPGASEEIMTGLEQRTNALPSLGKALADGQEIAPWLSRHFSPFSPEILEERPVHFRCRCNVKRMRLLFLHLPLADIMEMRDNGPFPIKLHCHFCNGQYLFEQKSLAEICLEKQSLT
ncbi:MAG: Hsp33 family molecular chaperone HslO [Desulfobulbaceae bacterium]